MRKFFLIKIIILMFITVVLAQEPEGARDLFVKYEDETPSTSANKPNTTSASKPANTSNSLTKPAGRPGMKLRIELNRDGQTSFVPANTQFRSGDKIKFHFRLNFPGYIAVVNIGTSGKSSILSYSRYDGNSRSEYVIPKGNASIAFDNRPGVEKVGFFISSKPIGEVQGASNTPASSNKPNNKPNNKPTTTGGIASASEEDQILNTINSRSLELKEGRDLYIENSKQDTYSYFVIPADKIAKDPVIIPLFLEHR